jgi:hypothetical protein
VINPKKKGTFDMYNDVYFKDCAKKEQEDFKRENAILKPFTKYIYFELWLNLPFKYKIVCFMKLILRLITGKNQSW